MKQDQKQYKQSTEIPATPPQPVDYAPPRMDYGRPMRLEWLGIGWTVAIVLVLFGWLLSVPASGESSYYEKVLNGEALGAGQHGAEH